MPHTLVEGMENYLAAIYKIKHVLILQTSNPTDLGICPKGILIYAHMQNCMQIFIASLFINAKNWETK